MAGAPVELAAVVTLAWIVGYVIWAYAPVSPPAGKPMEPVAQPSPVVLVQPTPEALRRQRGRSIAIALALGGLVALFYIATIVRLGSNVANRAL